MSEKSKSIEVSELKYDHKQEKDRLAAELEAIKKMENAKIKSLSENRDREGTVPGAAESQPSPGGDQEPGLPEDQWLVVNCPMSILGGKVIVIVVSVREVSRKTIETVRVDVPKRRPFQQHLKKGQSLPFKYYDQQYSLTLMEAELQEQRANLTIREQ